MLFLLQLYYMFSLFTQLLLYFDTCFGNANVCFLMPIKSLWIGLDCEPFSHHGSFFLLAQHVYDIMSCKRAIHHNLLDAPVCATASTPGCTEGQKLRVGCILHRAAPCFKTTPVNVSHNQADFSFFLAVRGNVLACVYTQLLSIQCRRAGYVLLPDFSYGQWWKRKYSTLNI